MLRGHRLHRTLAKDVATGRLIGHSVLTVPESQNDIAVQHDTAVTPSDRPRGVGTALKEAMLASLAQDEPQLKRVLTWNSADNDSIRRINSRLGFREVSSITAWELLVSSEAT